MILTSNFHKLEALAVLYNGLNKPNMNKPRHATDFMQICHIFEHNFINLLKTVV